ncbi:uncharacterized protein WCI35_007222, partial [Daubentonia madagascariensis]
GAAARSWPLRPGYRPHGLSPGPGDPGAAPAAGPAGPGAAGPGETSHRGDPWRTHDVPPPAEAQALGGRGFGRVPPRRSPRPRAAGLPDTQERNGPGGAWLGGSSDYTLNGAQWVPG